MALLGRAGPHGKTPMFKVTRPPRAIDALVLSDEEAGTRAEVAPSRGALATSFVVDEREIFYLDEATFLDREKNVRGGNPILFPFPGRLAGDRFEQGGRAGAMKQHGFARNAAWDVVATDTKEAAAVTLALSSGETTLAQYPWEFRAKLTYSLRGRALRAGLAVENQSAEPMPFAVGFHPYFRLADVGKAKASVVTTATRAFDNTTKETVAFRGIDLAAGEVDLHLLDHPEDFMTLRSAEGSITVRGSAEMTVWVVWTLPGRDFVCVEPWTSPGDALNTGERLLWAEPGQTRRVWMEITAGE